MSVTTIRGSSDASSQPRDRGEADAVPLGTVLAKRYRLLEELGQGASGAVFRARDLTLGTDIAVKLYAPELTGETDQLLYALDEVRLARRVTHPNVCRVYDIEEVPDPRVGASAGDEAATIWLITMELVEGESLASRLERQSPLAVAEAERILRQVASGLAAAHDAGVVHRDLKPANVLLLPESSESRAVVADFGIAVEAERARELDVAGTRGYMAPEQAAGKPVDARSDVYALGVLAYRMLAGGLPPAEVEPAPTAGEIAASLPLPARESHARFIAACLQADPAHRPSDARAALELMTSAEPSARPATSKALLAGTLVAAATIAGIAIALAPPATTGEQDPASPLGALARANDIVIFGPWRGATDDIHSKWAADAVRVSVQAELEDAWGIEVRLQEKSPADGVFVTGVVERDASRRARADLTVVGISGGEVSSIPLALGHQAESIDELVLTLAARITSALVPAKAQRPTQRDLESVGASSKAAWRDWRRAQRASRMQDWNRARALSERAIALDDEFPMPHLEIGMSYDHGDAAQKATFARGFELAERKSDMSPLWTLVVTILRQLDTGQAADAARNMASLLAMDIDERHHRYFKTRWAMDFYYTRDREEGVNQLVWIADKWPDDGAAAKLLCDYYLQFDTETDRAQALQYARRAATQAPADLGARANLGLTLLRIGKRQAALEQLQIIDRADPEARQSAFADHELTHDLFELHIALGDWAAAERDARSLLAWSQNQQESGHAAMAMLLLMRGQTNAGLDRLMRAAEISKEQGQTAAFAHHVTGYAWHALHLGALDEAERSLARLDTYRDLPKTPVRAGTAYGARARILRAIAAIRAGRPTPSGQSLRQLEKQVTANLDSGSRTREFIHMLVDFEEGELEGALERVREIRTQRQAIAVLYFGARALERLGELVAAAEAYAAFVDHPKAWSQPVLATRGLWHLGQVRESLGDIAGARAAYRAFLERWGQADRAMSEVETARERLRSLESRARDGGL